MKITDVVTLLEYGAVGSKALGGANFKMLVDFYQGRKTAATLTLTFGDDVIKLSDPEVDALADHYNQLQDMSDKRDFVYNTMSRSDKFLALADRLNLNVTPVNMSAGQAGLFEREKKEQPDLSRSGVKDPKLSVALRQAYAKYPSARSDIEAFIRNEIENQTTTDQSFGAQNKTNARQDQTLDRLRDLSKKQSQQIANLDQENDSLDNELNQLNREIDGMERQLRQGGNKEPVSRSKVDLPKADKEPSAFAGSGQTRRSDSREKREKDKDQRNTEINKPANTNTYAPPTIGIKPPVEPAAKSQPAATQTAPMRDQPLPTTVDRGPRAPKVTKDPNSNVTYMYNEPVELPAGGDDVLPTINRARADRQADMFDQPRTGTMGETVRRLKELAGL